MYEPSPGCQFKPRKARGREETRGFTKLTYQHRAVEHREPGGHATLVNVIEL